MQFHEYLRNLYRYGLEYYAKYYGVYRGLVVNNQDPKVLGRLVVQVPQIHGNDYPTYWAPSKGVPSGIQMGLWALPRVNDLVWVEFENGDARFPVWSYGHYMQPSQVPSPAQVQNNYFFQTPQGQRLELNDTEGTITLVRPSGNTIQLMQDGRITIFNEAQNLQALLNSLLDILANLEVVTPAGDGITGPTSLQAIMQLKVQLLQLLA